MKYGKPIEETAPPSVDDVIPKSFSCLSRWERWWMGWVLIHTPAGLWLLFLFGLVQVVNILDVEHWHPYAQIAVYIVAFALAIFGFVFIPIYTFWTAFRMIVPKWHRRFVLQEENPERTDDSNPAP